MVSFIDSTISSTTKICHSLPGESQEALVLANQSGFSSIGKQQKYSVFDLGVRMFSVFVLISHYDQLFYIQTLLYRLFELATNFSWALKGDVLKKQQEAVLV